MGHDRMSNGVIVGVQGAVRIAKHGASVLLTRSLQIPGQQRSGRRVESRDVSHLSAVFFQRGAHLFREDLAAPASCRRGLRATGAVGAVAGRS